MARHFLDNSWLADSFSLQQWPGTNFIYWSIAGVGLKFLSFGQLAFWTRLINYLLYAFPLERIFRKLNIPLLPALLLLQVFFLKQEYLAGEWIWKGFEGKTLAYLFIFWSIDSVLDSRYYKAAVLAALATYCHVLVGGWYFAGVGLFLLFQRTPFKSLVLIAATYTAIAAPFVGYLALNLFGGESVQSDPPADWIYVFYRNLHHLVPTMKDHFWEHEWPFVAIIVISLILLYRPVLKDERGIKISRLVVAFNVLLIGGLILTYVDSKGTFLKIYVLRMSSLALFFELLWLTMVLRTFVKIPDARKRVALIALAVLLVIAAGAGVNKNIPDWTESKSEAAYREFIDFAKQSTAEGEKFCFIGYNDKNENVRFIHDGNRDRLVSYKMVPEGDVAILEWYNRILQRDALAADPLKFALLSAKYELSYLVSKNRLSTTDYDGELIYENPFYFVYKVP